MAAALTAREITPANLPPSEEPAVTAGVTPVDAVTAVAAVTDAAPLEVARGVTAVVEKTFLSVLPGATLVPTGRGAEFRCFLGRCD